MPDNALPQQAAIIVIGNEILSGRTQDQNIAFIAQKLNMLGIVVAEVRIIPDIEGKIIETINTLRKSYTYVFTTGGIGPTHDDITAKSVAEAFNVSLELHESVAEILKERYLASGLTVNEAQLKMAYFPQGAQLIANPVTQVPGFSIENVYVFAGVPAIMRAMFEEVAALLKHGAPIRSKTVLCYLGEGRLALGLANIQAAYPQVDIGSYPFWSINRHGTSIVIRGIDSVCIDRAARDVGDLMRRCGGEPEFEVS